MTVTPPGSEWRPLDIADLMHGRPDPERDLGQSGVRLPRYVIDAIRTAATLSKGEWTMQALVIEAVKRFAPQDLLHKAWHEHGGGSDGPPRR